MKRNIPKPEGTVSLHGDQLKIVTIIGKKTTTQQMKKTVKVTVTYTEKTVTYTIKDTRPDKRVASPAYSLTRNDDGTVYHCWRDEWGMHCDCPDAHFNRGLDPLGCKHTRSLKAVGLFD